MQKEPPGPIGLVEQKLNARVLAPGPVRSYPAAMPASTSLLVVEDDPTIGEPLVEALQREGFTVS